MFELQLSKSVIKTLAALPKKPARQIYEALKALVTTPLSLKVKKLKGHDNFLRKAVGEYRIIYKINPDKNVIQIYLIGKRNDKEVYRQFKRLSKS